MQETLSILRRLEIYAEAGETLANLKLWKPQIKKLVKDGFTIDVISPTLRRGEYSCLISWKHPNGAGASGMLNLTIKSLQQMSAETSEESEH